MKKQSLKPELLNDILQEAEELIKVFVTSIKTAEKKPRLGVIECSVLYVCFFIRCWTFDVRCSTFNFQNNPAWPQYLPELLRRVTN